MSIGQGIAFTAQQVGSGLGVALVAAAAAGLLGAIVLDRRMTA